MLDHDKSYYIYTLYSSIVRSSVRSVRWNGPLDHTNSRSRGLFSRHLDEFVDNIIIYNFKHNKKNIE